MEAVKLGRPLKRCMHTYIGQLGNGHSFHIHVVRLDFISNFLQADLYILLLILLVGAYSSDKVGERLFEHGEKVVCHVTSNV